MNIELIYVLIAIAVGLGATIVMDLTAISLVQTNSALLTDAEPHPIKWTPRPNARGGSNGGAGYWERWA